MKSLRKKDFLPILKLVVDVLESNDIEYEIPYCHIDKNIFNYQDIIIPNTTDISNLIINLNISNYENNLNIFSGEIEQFKFNFIKIPLDYKSNAFYHYCWNFYPFLIKSLFKGIGLSYDFYGLHFPVNNTKKITLTKNLNDILEFIGIDFKSIYGINVPDKRKLYQTIIDSSYFSSNFFTKKILKELDPMYKLNERYYKDFFDIMPFNKIEIDNNDMLIIFDSYFNCNLIDKLLKIKLKNDFPEIEKIRENLKNNIQVNNNIDDYMKELKEKRNNKKKIKLRKMKKEDLKFKKYGNTIKIIGENEK
jgi:hypothetical protein